MSAEPTLSKQHSLASPRAALALILTTAILNSSCNLRSVYLNGPAAAGTAALNTAPVVSSIQMMSNNLIVSGSSLSGTTQITVSDGVHNYPLNILDTTATSLYAYSTATSSVGLIVGTLYSLILTNAYGSSTTTFTFNLQSIPTDGLAVGVNELVTAGGNVGIGTVSPALKLDVVGTIRAGSGSSSTDVGATLNPSDSATNSYRNGLGMNLFFNSSSTNWTTASDGTYNAGQAILGTTNGNGMQFFTIPSNSTVGSAQLVPDGGTTCSGSNPPMACYERMEITDLGTIDVDPHNYGTEAVVSGALSSYFLTFGTEQTEGIGSNRTPGSKGLDFFTSALARLSISSGGTVTIAGHVASSGTAPTVSSCGTTPPVVTGTDSRGTFTLGTGSPTACTLTFATAYATAPFCVVTASGSNPGAIYWIASTSTTAFVLNIATGISSQAFNYYCVQ